MALPGGVGLELGDTSASEGPHVTVFVALLVGLRSRLLLVQAGLLVVGQHGLAVEELAVCLEVQVSDLALVCLI